MFELLGSVKALNCQDFVHYLVSGCWEGGHHSSGYFWPLIKEEGDINHEVGKIHKEGKTKPNTL